jgi:pimeloyl-ACP methyl ester carboxylesterase
MIHGKPALRRVETPSLSVACLEYGPPDGEPVVALHGFPDDASTWDRIAPDLAASGHRVLAPYVRGFGATQLREGISPSGEIAALALDTIELLDALGIERAHVIGHDWGARAGYAAAALYPERIATLTALAVAHGTNVTSQNMDVAQSRAYWYQWYFATPRGAAHLENDRTGFCRALWRLWSPGWEFDEAEYARAAASFGNPEFVRVVLSSYRQRWGFEPGADRYASVRAILETVPPIAVPTLTIMGAADGATLPSSAAGKERLFTASYRLAILDDCGHFIPRERAREVVLLRRDWLPTLG